ATDPDRSPFDERGDLPEPGPPGVVTVVPVEDAPPTALGVELRDGRIGVFLPPLTHFEDAVALLAVVEAAVVEAGHPVVIEGYPPPGDPRQQVLVVTPDPGVIEVNLHPA